MAQSIQQEINEKDAAAFRELSQAILQNKRLSWIIVSGWLKENHKLLMDDKESMNFPVK